MACWQATYQSRYRLWIPFDVRGYIDLGDLGDADSFYFEFPSDISTTLGDVENPDACNMGEMVHTVQSVLDLLDTAIKSDVLSQLPLIGDLSEEGSFFQDIRDGLDVALLALEDTDGLRQFIFDTFGPPGLGILVGVTTIADIGDFSGAQTTNAIIDPLTIWATQPANVDVSNCTLAAESPCRSISTGARRSRVRSRNRRWA